MICASVAVDGGYAIAAPVVGGSMIHSNHNMPSLGRIRTLLLATVLLLFASPVLAQTMPPAAPPAAPVLDPATAARMETQARLTSALSRIAANGSDVQALTQAGRAALSLGDPRAALGFLARAESLAPRDPIIKAALGATMVQLEDPSQAMRFFEAAIALGGLERAYLADRGLAFDLLGDQTRAQADYVAAGQFAPSPEVTRRHAISLGISGNSEAAVAMLGPLLRAQDRGAWRSRAMIVAMNGRADEARQIAAATMPPQLASGLSPYFAMMDRLTPQQLAAAAHFGRFPSYEVVAAQSPRVRRADVAVNAVNPPVRDGARGGRDGRRVVAANSATGRTAARTAQRTRAERTAPRPTPAPAPRLVHPVAPALVPPPPPPARAIAFPPMPTPVPALAVPAVSPPVQPVLRETIRPSIITPSRTIPPADAATANMRSMGPPDSIGPGFTALPAPAVPAPVPASPIPAPVLPTITTVELPPSVPPADVPAAVEIAAPAAIQPLPQSPPVAPTLAVPTAPPANTAVVSGWSLADVVQSIEVPPGERQIEAGALSIDELDAIATQRRRAAAAAATETRRRQQEDTRLRTEREAADRERTAEAAAAREAEQVARRHPARTWVQVATGSDASALAADYRRFSQRNSAIFQGQSGATAVWNRTRRLVVGPFANSTAARTWLNRYAAAGGEGFVWTSDAGEEVTPIGRR